MPGVGATPAQFGALKDALADEVDYFDGFEYSLAHPDGILFAGADFVCAHDKASNRAAMVFFMLLPWLWPTPRRCTATAAPA